MTAVREFLEEIVEVGAFAEIVEKDQFYSVPVKIGIAFPSGNVFFLTAERSYIDDEPAWIEISKPEGEAEDDD